MDLQTFEQLKKKLTEAGTTPDPKRRLQLATDIFKTIAGNDVPAPETGLVERLKALNQQFSDEKNAALEECKQLRARAQDAEARAANADDVLRQHKTFTKNREAIMQALAELIDATGDVKDATTALQRRLA
jgi:hypothetical protein